MDNEKRLEVEEFFEGQETDKFRFELEDMLVLIVEGEGGVVMLKDLMVYHESLFEKNAK